MHPFVLSGRDGKAQRFQTILLCGEIGEGDFERDVVNRGGRRIGAPITGTCRAVEQGKHLAMLAVPVCNPDREKLHADSLYCVLPRSSGTTFSSSFPTALLA